MAYTLWIFIEPNGAGGVILSPKGDYVSPSQRSYPAGTVVTITAVPCYISGGYFDHWGGAISGTTNPIAVIMDSNKSVDVNYYVPPTAPLVTLTTGVEGAGSVGPSSGVFNPGDQIILVATPAPGYAFDSWSGDIDGTSSVSGLPNHLLVTMNKDRYIMARFITVPSPVVARYYVTVAEGATLDELKADSEAKHVDGPFRLVVETLSAPDWMLASGAWLFNALKVPLNAVGVSIEEVKVENKNLMVYMHGSPFLILLLAGIAAGALVAIALYIVHLKVQQEVTQRLAIELEKTKTKQEVTNAILAEGLPPEVTETLIKAVWESGYTPEEQKAGIDWEKYLKWGLIGGGVILGAAVLIPAIVKK